MDYKDKFDLLKKLVALANHNPHENEANAAARRVCKMLEENEFSFVQKTSPPPFAGGFPFGVGHPFNDIFNDMFHAQRQERARQQARQGEWRHAPPKSTNEPGKPPPGSDRETKKAETETRSSPHQGTARDPFAEYKEGFKPHPAQEEFYGGRDYNAEFRNWPGDNVKRNLKCTTCGHIKSTRFRGAPETWICMECRGKEYTKSKL